MVTMMDFTTTTWTTTHHMCRSKTRFVTDIFFFFFIIITNKHERKKKTDTKAGWLPSPLPLITRTFSWPRPEINPSSCGRWPEKKATTATREDACTVTRTLSKTSSSPRTGSSPCPVPGTVPWDCGTWTLEQPRDDLSVTAKTSCPSRSPWTTDKSSPAPEIRRLNCGTLWASANTRFKNTKATRSGFLAFDSPRHRRTRSSSRAVGINSSRCGTWTTASCELTWLATPGTSTPSRCRRMALCAPRAVRMASPCSGI